jgi:pimeloyl-ACP methyl ester carboxylesterase
MLSHPADIAAQVLRGTLGYDALPAAASVSVPVLHIAGTPPRNQPHLLAEWLPGVITAWPVARGHFAMLEAPEQVNLMIEASWASTSADLLGGSTAAVVGKASSWNRR